MPRSDVLPSPEGQISLRVRPEDLASQLTIPTRGTFPAVFATSRMVALMECAAAQCLEPLLEPGELSVGVSVDVRHTAATPVGVEVTATAKHLGIEGKSYLFEVTAHDSAEVGRGRHARAIISTKRLLESAERRRGES